MHRFSGPYRGYFIAAYTERRKGGFIGYGMACVKLPKSAWRAPAPADITTSVYLDEDQALSAAENRIRLEIADLPPSWAPFTVPGALIDTQKDSR